MRNLCLLFVLCAISICDAADSIAGTIALNKNEDVVFRFAGGSTKYQGEIPGIKVLGLSKLSKIEGDSVNGIPMLIIELASGERVTLVQGKPVAITRTISGKTVEWHIGPK